MVLFVLAYLGGVLTIVSPCILPVLPFVFARADRPFVRNGVPMLVGMAVTFAVVATLAAVAGGWAVKANQYGRAAAIMLLAMFGFTLIFPRLADHLAKPFVTLGARLSNPSSTPTRRSNQACCPRFCSVLRPVSSGCRARVRSWGSSCREPPCAARALERRCCCWHTRQGPPRRWRWHCSSAAASSP